jgi:hypothetical protein
MHENQQHDLSLMQLDEGGATNSKYWCLKLLLRYQFSPGSNTAAAAVVAQCCRLL